MNRHRTPRVSKTSYLLLLCTMLYVSGCASSNRVSEETLSGSNISSLMIDRISAEEKIQSEDIIEISVWGYEEFNTIKTVNPNGFIIVPLVGEIKAAGMNKDEFSANLKSELSKYIKGEINLSLTVSTSQKNIISVLGQVGRPDNYDFNNSAPILEVLSKAGGITEDADLRSVKIYHYQSGEKTTNLDLTEYLSSGKLNKRYRELSLVNPGDIVYVPKQENVIRELSTFLRDVALVFGLFRIFN